MKSANSGLFSRQGLLFFLLIAAVLSVLFWQSFVPGRAIFSNDGPLSVHKAAWYDSSGKLLGLWGDLNGLGANNRACAPDISTLIRGALGAEGYTNFSDPLALLIAGVCAWLFFRRLGLAVVACSMAGLAVALNSDFFSTACWGVSAQVICFGMNFLAMALVVSNKPEDSLWLRMARLSLAGLAVGVGVMEGADNGAIFSVLTAAFVVWVTLFEAGKPALQILKGVGRTALIAAFAGFIAISAIYSLVGNQIEGVAVFEQGKENKAAQWNWATTWSMPKIETLGLAVPGLFGYRIYGATPETMYWGGVGRDPSLDPYFEKNQPPPGGGQLRFIGSGIYAGIPVLLVVLWATMQAFRREDSPFSLAQRRMLWFWIAVAVISLFLSYGRFAGLYQFFYAIPYASNIRNPVKFLHVLSYALLVLFAYGIDGMYRRYLAGTGASAWSSAQAGWAKARAIDRRWVIGIAVILGVGLLAWQGYSSSRKGLIEYLQAFGQFDPDNASILANYSIQQAGWGLFFLALSVIVLGAMALGYFAGSRATIGALLFGAVMVWDLGRANLPWLYYWDVAEKYASNPIIDMLRDKPYEHRVIRLPFGWPAQFNLFHMVHRREWLEQHFVYYNIQSLDQVQRPRPPADEAAYESTLASFDTNAMYKLPRYWQLTNVRYLLGPAGYVPLLNQQFDPIKQRFRVAALFDIVPKPGVREVTRLEQYTAETNSTGPYGLIEFTGALPRAGLYTHWQVSTNDQETLQLLGRESFDPELTVIVPTNLPTAPGPTNKVNSSAASVEYRSYTPKLIELQSRADLPSVLLMNDKHDPAWEVYVDGKRSPLMRCNYLMRGVYLPAGSHTIVFRFALPHGLLYVSLAAIGVGFLLLGVAALTKRSSAATGAAMEGAKSKDKPQVL
jgi:hypothetical protein